MSGKLHHATFTVKVHRDLIETAEEKIERRRRTKRISATVAAEVRWRRRRTAGLFVVGLLYAVVYYYAHQVDWEGDGDVDVDQPESGLLALVLLHAWNAKLALMRYRLSCDNCTANTLCLIRRTFRKSHTEVYVTIGL